MVLPEGWGYGILFKYYIFTGNTYVRVCKVLKSIQYQEEVGLKSILKMSLKNG